MAATQKRLGRVPGTASLAWVGLVLALATACDDLARGARGRISVEPTEVVFIGALPPFTHEARVQVRNVGGGELDVTAVELRGDLQFELGAAPRAFKLRPMAAQELVVRYRAIDFMERTATLTITSADPDAPTVTVPIRSEELVPKIAVTHCVLPDAVLPGASPDGGAHACAPAPSPLLDFGEVRPGRCRQAEVHIANSGSAQLVVASPAFQAGSSADIAFVGGRPPEAHLAPVDELGMAASTFFRVSFCPPLLDSDAEATMLVLSNDPATPQVLVRLTGRSRLGRCEVVDQLVQPPTTRADMLFVIDNSGSMADNQTNLRRNFVQLADYLQHQTIDFQVGVVTTDNGTLRGTPAVIYAGDDNPVAEFDLNANVGTSGSGSERGFQFAQTALSPPLSTGANMRFLRADSALELVFVSDEEDQSSGTVDSYLTFFRSLVGPGRASQVRVSAIVGDAPNGCETMSGSAEAGARYVQAVRATSGVFGSICSPSFANTLETIGRGIGPQRELRLTRPPDRMLPMEVRRYAGRAACEADTTFTMGTPVLQGGNDGYLYDASSNRITFLREPELGTCVKVRYTTRCVQP